MEKRKQFLERLQNMKIEKEPKTDGFELTKETVEEQIEKYSKVLESKIFKAATDGEER